MRIIRFLLKMVVFPIMLIVTVIQWFGAFIIGFSSAVFNVLAGLFLLVAVLSYFPSIIVFPEMIPVVRTIQSKVKRNIYHNPMMNKDIWLHHHPQL